MKPMNDDARIIELNRLEDQAKRELKRTHSIYFSGENHNIPVFKVDINFPLFRMENGRTKRKQIEFSYKNPERAQDLDDPSSSVAQAIQQEILQEMGAEADLLELLKQGQHEPLLLRHDGYVVNGNRRLAAMRLLHSDPDKYKVKADFSFVDVARLPILDEKETDLPDAYLILAWNFLKEFLPKKKDYIMNGGKFIVPIPSPVVIDKKNYEQF